jgi:integrase
MKRARIRKRPYTYKGKTKIRWIVTWTDAKGNRHEKWQPNHYLAEAYAGKVDREIDEAVHVADRATVMFGTAAEAYVARLERRHNGRNADLAGSTVAQYLCILRKHILPRFERVKLNELRTVNVQRWLDELGEKYARSYLDVIYVVVKEVLKYAVEQEWLVRNPLKDRAATRPGKIKKRADVPAPGDVRQLFAYLFGPRPPQKANYVWRNLRVACALAALGGLRAGECRALRWERVDLDSATLFIQLSESWYDGVKPPKSEAGVRSIPMHPILRGILADHADFLSSDEVFSGRHHQQRRGPPLDRSSKKGFVLRHPTGRAVGWDLSRKHFHTAMLEAGLVRYDKGETQTKVHLSRAPTLHREHVAPSRHAP